MWKGAQHRKNVITTAAETANAGHWTNIGYAGMGEGVSYFS
jgi:hypothetical protein